MSKMLIDVDEVLLSRAAEILGASTKKDTVNIALRDVVDRDERAKGLAWLFETSALADLDDSEVVRSARR